MSVFVPSTIRRRLSVGSSSRHTVEHRQLACVDSMFISTAVRLDVSRKRRGTGRGNNYEIEDLILNLAAIVLHVFCQLGA